VGRGVGKRCLEEVLGEVGEVRDAICTSRLRMSVGSNGEEYEYVLLSAAAEGVLFFVWVSISTMG
jgi:hypothetical protein